MKIVFLHDNFPPMSFGGGGISNYELAQGMQKAGHDVSVITTCRRESDAGESEYHGIKVFRIANDYDGRWRAWFSLYNPPVVRQVEKLLKKIQPDVAHANNIHFYLSYYCLKLAKRYAKVVVWTARDVMSFNYGKLTTKRYLENFDGHTTWCDHIKQAGKRWNPFRNFLIKKYLAYADKLCAVSAALQKALEQNGIKNVEVVHTGIDASAWQISREAVATFRKKYDLGSKKVILFGGRLNAGTQVVRAMKLLVQALPAVLLVMGKKENAEQMKIESNGLDIVYTGWLSGEEKIAAYYASNVVWVPSAYFDAFPRSALEASAAGKPVIATKFGGAAELVQDGETGYIVNPFHPQEIAEKTLDLLKNPEKAEQFGKAGYKRVETRFNLDEYIASYVSYYRALAE